MVKIGAVWDRTTEVIAGRSGILASIAALLLFLPSVVQAAITAAIGQNAALAFVVNIVGLVVAALAIWGSLSLTAVASDPVVDRSRGVTLGANRLPAALGVLLVAMVAALVLSLPGIWLLLSSGFDFERARAGLSQPALNGGRLAAATAYFLLYLLVAFWLSARLLPLFAVIVNERLGLGAFARSFALTRGSTWKLIGVLILYAIVAMVVLIAATSIIGLVFRLILGADSVATVMFITALVGSVVTTGLTVLQCVFGAQFYIAASGRATVA